MAATFNDVMVDIETTGLDASHNAILQIAAVKFDYASGAIGPVFCRSLSIPGHRTWDMGTRQWWSRQEHVLEKILATADDPGTVMREFAEFSSPFDPSVAQRFWAKPTHFDYVFIQRYASDYWIDLPFHYRSAVDMNSFIRGLARDPGLQGIGNDIPFVGDAHNALDDAFHQIRILLTAKETYK